MAKVVIFGVLDTAQLAHFYLTHDSEHTVAAFTAHKKYLPESRSFEGLPVVPFEEIQQQYSPDDFHFFAPMTARRMNRQRESVYHEALEKGYRFVSYVSSRATVFPGAEIGRNCLILEDNTIQPFTPIGNNVVLWSGNHIGHHGRIDDHVFITSHVVLSGHCNVEKYCFFGVNSTVRDHTRIAEGTLVTMGACVMGDTEAWGVYGGNPARKQRQRSDEIDF